MSKWEIIKNQLNWGSSVQKLRPVNKKEKPS